MMRGFRTTPHSVLARRWKHAMPGNRPAVPLRLLGADGRNGDGRVTLIGAGAAARDLSVSSKGGKAGGQNSGRSGAGKGRSMKGRGAAGGGATKGGSSGLWMKRHLKDPYVSAAVESGAPSRAAFKLVEINDKHTVISPGDRVLDLGAAPGGWSMVAARIVHGQGRRLAPRDRRVGAGSGRARGAPPRLPPPLPDGSPKGKEKGGVVVAIDLLDMEALPGVEVIRGDFRDASVEAKIFATLVGRSGDGLVSRPVEGGAQTDFPISTSGGWNFDRVEDGTERKAFRIRGTSSSEMLLPRPAKPAADPLEALLFAAKPNPKPPGYLEPEQAPTERGPGSAGKEARLAVNVASGRPSSPLRNEGVVCRPLALPPRKLRANVVLSDMAPSFTGDRDTDQARVAGLVLDALAACLGDENGRMRKQSDFEEDLASRGKTEKSDVDGGIGDGRISASGLRKYLEGEEEKEGEGEGLPVRGRVSNREALFSADSSRGNSENRGSPSNFGLLARGGTFLGKLFAGRDEREVKLEVERLFESVRIVKPPASRSGSSEMYVLATGFLLGTKKRI